MLSSSSLVSRPHTTATPRPPPSPIASTSAQSLRLLARTVADIYCEKHRYYEGHGEYKPNAGSFVLFRQSIPSVLDVEVVAAVIVFLDLAI